MHGFGARIGNLTLCLPLAAAVALAVASDAAASPDDVRNAHAKKDCVRGKFKSYYR
jgi:hypothetical protein